MDDGPHLMRSQRLRVALLSEDDASSCNTICIPFEDVFNDIVTIKATRPEEERFAVYNRKYHIRAVETLLGTWLSRVTEYALGSLEAAYDSTFIALVEPRISQALRKRGIVGEGTKPNFPDIYKRGDVPADYEPTRFNPDVIYPGQRFLFATPVEQFSFPEQKVEAPPGFFDGVWVGFVVSAQAEIGIGGTHHADAFVLNLGDILRYGELRRFTTIDISGWSVGVGVGASGGVGVIFFMNFPTIESLNFIEAPTTDDWWAKNWDWDIALAAKVPEGSLTETASLPSSK